MTTRSRRLRAIVLLAAIVGTSAVACAPDPAPAPGPSTTSIAVTTVPNG